MTLGRRNVDRSKECGREIAGFGSVALDAFEERAGRMRELSLNEYVGYVGWDALNDLGVVLRIARAIAFGIIGLALRMIELIERLPNGSVVSAPRPTQQPGPSVLLALYPRHSLS
jgi:hypothetical protein